MRKQELSEEVIAILHTRIHLSRSGAFSMRRIWEGWGMSKATLYRYRDNKYRELSREITRKANQHIRDNQGDCAKCAEPIKGHRRCVRCTILIHSEVRACRCRRRHGESRDGIFCLGCIDTESEEILSPYQELYGDSFYYGT